MTQPTAAPGRTSSWQVAIIIAAIALALNGLFFILSQRYLASRGPDIDAANLLQLRGAFGMFSGLVALGAIAASIAPKLIGHALGAVMGVASFAAGVEALTHALPAALWVALLITGVLMPLLAVRSWTGGRAAWAFLNVICGTFGVCLLFGAPKVRALLGIGLWHALIIPGLMFTASAALSAIHGSYREG
jgi:hypothetical protein